MKKLNQKLRGNAGITLVEVMITIFILSVGVLSSLLYFTAASISTELARDMFVATNHGEYVLEEMRSRATLADITATDWTSWATATGLNTLSNEAITVSFADAAADPLSITATVTWDTRLRSTDVSLITEMTK